MANITIIEDEPTVRWTCCCGSATATLTPGAALRATCRLCGARADLVAPRHIDHRHPGGCQTAR